MILSHRIALDPTEAQRRYFAKAAGCARFVWNLALAEWNRRYAAGEKKIKADDIKSEFNSFKYQAFPWMKSIHRDAHSQPFYNLRDAFRGFFKKQGKHPTFHKKGRKDSFYVANDQFHVAYDVVQLPRIGIVKMHEELRFKGKVMGAVVSRQADKWFISVQVEMGDVEKDRTENGVVGVDLGINAAATLSTGEKILAPKPLKKELRKLKRISRKQSRQLKGGKNRAKTNAKLARIHARVANIRKDFWQKVTTRLCRENQAIAIEDLNVAGMKRNRKLARALTDVSIGMFRPMVEYKSKIYQNSLTVADRWHPSSKTCSCCGAVKDKMSLSERMFECDSCGAVLDRDENAALNLKNLIPTAGGKSMSVDSERLLKARREAETTMLVSRQQLLERVV